MRRFWMALVTACALFSLHGTAQALMNEPFFEDSFLNFKEDAESAADQGKILMVFYEQEGCPYCTELHQKTLKDPAVLDYMEQHFYPILVDIFGAREAMGFDGAPTREKALSRAQRVHYTPTVVFYGPSGVELFRLAGFWKPFHFLASMEYVFEDHHHKMNFQDFIRAKINAEKSEKK
ncbi:MAG: thioredoxin fold domain-containing protein [Magnetococcales bacterium]|nr:thioredoxin fold domain-containing protein [Magnetococcales bacterium]